MYIYSLTFTWTPLIRKLWIWTPVALKYMEVVVLDPLHRPEWRVFLLRWVWYGNDGSAADNWTEIRKGLITLSVQLSMCSVYVFSQLQLWDSEDVIHGIIWCCHVVIVQCKLPVRYKEKLHYFYRQQYPLWNALLGNAGIHKHTQLQAYTKSTFSSRYDHMTDVFS